MDIENERPEHVTAIRDLTARAFKDMPYSDGSEPVIIDRLRAAGALELSLMARKGRAIVGHVAASPVTISGDQGWYGIGPISFEPAQQRSGIGSALMGAVLARLEARGAKGAVLVGDPAYYQRFGFRNDLGLRYADLEPQYVMGLAFKGEMPSGEIEFHEAFSHDAGAS